MQHLTAAERMHTFHNAYKTDLLNYKNYLFYLNYMLTSIFFVFKLYILRYIYWNQNMDGKSLGFFDKGQGNQNLNQISL